MAARLGHYHKPAVYDLIIIIIIIYVSDHC